MIDEFTNWLLDLNKPRNLYVGLLDDSVEIQGRGYARVSIDPNCWSRAKNCSIHNVHDVTFAPAKKRWKLVSRLALFTKRVKGNMLLCGWLARPQTIGRADTAAFKPGELEIWVR